MFNLCCSEQHIVKSVLLIHSTADDVRNAGKAIVKKNEYHKNNRRGITQE